MQQVGNTMMGHRAHSLPFSGVKSSASLKEAIENRMCWLLFAKVESTTVCQPSASSVKLGMAPGEIEIVAGSVAMF